MKIRSTVAVCEVPFRALALVAGFLKWTASVLVAGAGLPINTAASSLWSPSRHKTTSDNAGYEDYRHL